MAETVLNAPLEIDRTACSMDKIKIRHVDPKSKVHLEMNSIINNHMHLAHQPFITSSSKLKCLIFPIHHLKTQSTHPFTNLAE